jgi:hypothetical protein
MTTDIEKKTPDATPPAKTVRTLNIPSGTVFKNAEERGAVIATSPVIRAGMTGIEFAEKGGFGKELDLSEFSKRIRLQAEAVNKGDMTGPEQMLVSQAATLDAIFNTLARKAANCEHTQQVETNLRMALRAQSQCAATIRVLGELKNPKQVSFVKQQNNANGNQQVNNGPVNNGAAQTTVAPAGARERGNGPANELLTDRTDGEYVTTLDTRGTGTAARSNQALEPVEEINRAANQCGEGGIVSERISARNEDGREH